LATAGDDAMMLPVVVAPVQSGLQVLGVPEQPVVPAALKA
jgi:hypothetical protein